MFFLSHSFLKHALLAMCVFLFLGCDKKDSSESGDKKDSLVLSVDYSKLPMDKSAYDIYYISNDGVDSNDGRSHESPWKSLSKINQIQASKPILVLLDALSIFNESLKIEQSNIWIYKYHSSLSGSDSLPLIEGSRIIKYWKRIDGYFSNKLYEVDLAGSVASSQVGVSGLGNLSIQEGPIRFLPWKTYLTDTFGDALGDSKNYYSFDNNSKKMYLLNNTGDLAKEYYVSTRLVGVTAKDVSDVHLVNVDIKGFSLHGVNFESCTDCSVTGGHVSQVGGAVLSNNPDSSSDEAYLYAGNGIEFGGLSTGGRVTGVGISDVFDSCLSPQTYSNNQQQSDFVFKDVTMSGCGFAGVEISVLSNGGTTGSSINNVKIENASIENMGKGWSGQRYGTEGYGIRINADDSAGYIGRVDVIASEIENAINAGISIGDNVGEVIIHRSELNDNATGIRVEQTQARDEDQTDVLVFASDFEGNDKGIEINSNKLDTFMGLFNTFDASNSINLIATGAKANSVTLKNNVFSGEPTQAHLFFANDVMIAGLDYNCYQPLSGNIVGVDSDAYADITAVRSGTVFENNGQEATECTASADYSVISSDIVRSKFGEFSYTDLNNKAIADPAKIGAVQ